MLCVAVIVPGGLTELIDGIANPGIAVIVYGLIVWVVAASIVTPLWVNAALGMHAPVPTFMVERVLGNAVYGVLLGFVAV